MNDKKYYILGFTVDNKDIKGELVSSNKKIVDEENLTKYAKIIFRKISPYEKASEWKGWVIRDLNNLENAIIFLAGRGMFGGFARTGSDLV